jgi:hypothetical protein
MTTNNTPPAADGAPPSADEIAKVQAAVAGLAREVEAMRRAMRQVATAAELARLAEVVTELGETTTAASRARQQPDPVPSWLVLPTTLADTSAVLTDLRLWLGDVYLRYADAARGLPECWLWHPEIVEELVWLMYAWLAAYRDDEASVRAAGDWHDRLRPGVVRRISDYAGTCSLELHLPGRATGAPHVPVADAVDAIAKWWAEGRDKPGPEPTNDQMVAAAASARRARQAPTTDQTIAYAANANTHPPHQTNGANGRGGGTNPGTYGGAR